MRGLTPKEIENAPDWATHYWVDESNNVFFENGRSFMSLTDGIKRGPLMTGDVVRCDEALPIPGQ